MNRVLGPLYYIYNKEPPNSIGNYLGPYNIRGLGFRVYTIDHGVLGSGFGVRV